MKIISTFDKAKRVIDSCTDQIQLDAARKYVNLFFRYFSIPLKRKKNRDVVVTEQFVYAYYSELLKLIEEKRTTLTFFLAGLVLSLSSCSKDEIVIVEVPGPPIVIQASNYGIPSYNFISNTTSLVLKNKMNPGYSITRGTSPVPLEIINNGKTYMAVESSLLIFDYNGDGKDDVFAHLMESTPCSNNCGWITGPGLWFWWEDFENNPTPVVVDSHLWFGVRFEIADFNNDGLLELAAINQNHHDNGSGGWYSDYHPLELISLTKTSINVEDLGGPSGAHDLATGDIDNDGDIDIIEAEWLYGAPNIPSTPKFYINNGNGSFTITQELFGPFQIFQQAKYYDLSVTNIDLFDFNNDGHLDLFLGENNIEFEWWSESILSFFERSGYHPNDLTILFGDGTGNFSYENSYSTRYSTPTAAALAGLGFTMMGGNFVDFNNDGFYDYVVTTDFNQSGAGIKVFQNINGRSLVDVTESIVDKATHLYKNASSGPNAQISSGDLSSFFDTVILDIDNDGDYDIMPYSQVLMDVNSTVPNGVYWENAGGRFILKNHE